MILRLNRIAHPVTVLGPGRRLGLWVQGCSIHCSGCASLDTWDPSAGTPAETSELAPVLARAIVDEALTGVTLTGGEPTEQGTALADLVARVRRQVAEKRSEAVDVLMFTGRAAAAAARSAPSLWRVIDAAVCGPYRKNRPSSIPLLASANQTLEVLSPLGEERLTALRHSEARAIQVHVDDGNFTLIGLPGPGDLSRIEVALRRRGITMEGLSWPKQ